MANIFIDGYRLLDERDQQLPNVFKGTSDFSNNWFLGDGTSYSPTIIKDEKDPNGNLIASVSGSWKGLTQPISVQKGEIVTIGAYLRVINPSSSGSINSFATYGHIIQASINNGYFSSADGKILNYQKGVSTNWDWTTVTFQFNTSTSNTYIRFENDTEGVDYQIGSIVLVRSSFAKYWSPNPSDAITKFLELQKQIDQLKSNQKS